jgi:hypothetical protein
LKRQRIIKKLDEPYTGALELSNPKAHNFMARVGLPNTTKNKFLEFFEVNEVEKFNFKKN